VQDILRFIPSLRNMMQPVNRLPPEILSQIARDVPDEDGEDARTIIPLTHVCRYWRGSIISTPEHWTSISSRSRRLAVLSLERAKAAPLKLTVSDDDEPYWLPDLLAPCIQNTEALSVQCPSAIELKKVLPNFPQSMPSLRSLTLQSDDGWERSTDPFESFAPTMKYLSLNTIPLYPSLRKIRTLTELSLDDCDFNLQLDTLLDFLEENHSLASATIKIRFVEPSLCISQRRAAIKNRLRYLEILCYCPMDGQVLISNISLPKGATLDVSCCEEDMTVNEVLSGISTTHLSNLLSPTFMEYHTYQRTVRLLGPNGIASFCSPFRSDTPFIEFPRFPLASIREFRLDNRWWRFTRPPGPEVFHHLSSFPALETFTIKSDGDLSYVFSPLLSDPSASLSLKTLGFWDCILTEEFMERLTRFASDRKNTASAWLHRVVIVHREGNFPSIASIHKLKEHVPVVDVRIATELPKDLT